MTIYKPAFANFIASFLTDAKERLDKIDISNTNTYMVNARYVISFLFNAVEMLFKEVAQERFTSGAVNLKVLGVATRFDNLLNNNRFRGNSNTLLNAINTKKIWMADLLKVYQFGTDLAFFDLSSISDEAEILTLDTLRDARNKLIHNGSLDPNDVDALKAAFPIMEAVFHEVFQADYKIIEYSERIRKIPDKDPYKVLLEIYEAIIDELQSPTPDYWKIYCYAKFAICIILTKFYEIHRRGSMYDLLYFYHRINNYESESYTGLLREEFRNVESIDFYIKFQNIYLKIDPKNTCPEQILGSFDLNQIKKGLKQFLGCQSRYEVELNDDDAVRNIAYNQTRIGNIIIHSFRKEDWLAKYNLRFESPDTDKMRVLAALIKQYRNMITQEIAEEMFSLSLGFCKHFLNKFER